ncbi:hypothetical protein BD289DRAFT_484049 [Coniella lustricola]|uniref:Uncharacterized protein n=1 Tax=Coniella lustricola TaxID=2025994 RepID=A0A2T3A3A6_9PEZI|nr:hypothetical protein BD289DRAFT_484049 [Coniella lustricola]
MPPTSTPKTMRARVKAAAAATTSRRGSRVQAESESNGAVEDLGRALTGLDRVPPIEVVKEIKGSAAQSSNSIADITPASVICAICEANCAVRSAQSLMSGFFVTIKNRHIAALLPPSVEGEAGKDDDNKGGNSEPTQQPHESPHLELSDAQTEPGSPRRSEIASLRARDAVDNKFNKRTGADDIVLDVTQSENSGRA